MKIKDDYTVTETTWNDIENLTHKGNPGDFSHEAFDILKPFLKPYKKEHGSREFPYGAEGWFDIMVSEDGQEFALFTDGGEAFIIEVEDINEKEIVNIVVPTTFEAFNSSEKAFLEKEADNYDIEIDIKAIKHTYGQDFEFNDVILYIYSTAVQKACDHYRIDPEEVTSVEIYIEYDINDLDSRLRMGRTEIHNYTELCNAIRLCGERNDLITNMY